MVLTWYFCLFLGKGQNDLTFSVRFDFSLKLGTRRYSDSKSPRGSFHKWLAACPMMSKTQCQEQVDDIRSSCLIYHSKDDLKEVRVQLKTISKKPVSIWVGISN